MAYEVRRFAVSTPAGTLATAPAVTELAMPARIARRLSVRFPPGSRGQLGVRVTSGGQAVIPVDAGTWIVGEDETIALDLQGYLESGAWELTSYNVGQYAHSVYLTFEVDPPQLVASPLGQPIAGPLDLGT